MSAAVVITPEAESHIRIIDLWWRKNRAGAPDLFSEELAASFELLAGAPMLGKRYPHATIRGVRRLLLRATRYHVYYTARGKAAVILAVWSAVRGTGPDMKRV